MEGQKVGGRVKLYLTKEAGRLAFSTRCQSGPGYKNQLLLDVIGDHFLLAERILREPIRNLPHKANSYGISPNHFLLVGGESSGTNQELGTKTNNYVIDRGMFLLVELSE